MTTGATFVSPSNRVPELVDNVLYNLNEKKKLLSIKVCKTIFLINCEFFWHQTLVTRLTSVIYKLLYTVYVTFSVSGSI